MLLSIHACDMASYNSRFFLDKGAPEYDLMEVYNEYMRRAGSHVHPQLVRDYMTRSGEMIDWMLKHVPEDYIKTYAHPTHYKGNRKFTPEDVKTLKQIHLLVKGNGMTLEGAAKKLRESRRKVDSRTKAIDSLKEIRKQLVLVRKEL